jgi:hypothetical protein
LHVGCTTDGPGPWSPAWSPTGPWAAIEGANQVLLVNTDDWRTVRIDGAFQPAWSQNGRHLAVVAGAYAVNVMNPDGSNRTVIGTSIAYPPVVWLL